LLLVHYVTETEV